tara:strand:- start:12192 stop:13634 length:1443 start_codon:yes stop_codon:yes gene_type:complete
MKCVIYIAHEQVGFFLSLAKLLANNYEVSFLAESKIVASVIYKHVPNADIMINDLSENLEIPAVLDRALDLERNYNVCLSKLMSEERGLGRGYLFNVDRYPPVKNAWWSHERKLSTIISRFEKAETILDRFRPDCIICWRNNPVFFTVASHRGLTSFSLAPVKQGERFIWAEDTFLTSPGLRSSIYKNLQQGIDDLEPVESYNQEALSKLRILQTRFTWAQAAKSAVHQILIEFYRTLRGTRKKNGYKFMGWVPVILRRQLAYTYFLKHGVSPSDLAGKRICFIPLHLEPEITLLSLSPEFNNSMEMISWISKAAPADVIVVVKENPASFGVRSKRYYDQLRQIGNVELADPTYSSWEWIETANLVATITGTAGTEGVIFGKPILSFGEHQAINILPTVRFANNYNSTVIGLNELLKIDFKDRLFELSKRAFYAAQMETSFELPGFALITESLESHDDVAAIALKQLDLRLEQLGNTTSQ